MLTFAILVFAASMVEGQPGQASPVHKELMVFQPYIGKWVGEVIQQEEIPGLAQKGEKLPVVLEFRWARNGNAVVGNLGATFKSGYVDLSQSLYVWDPQRETIVALDSNLDGAMSRADVSVKNDKLVFTVQGYKADGTSTSAIITYEPVKENAFRGWMTERKEGGKKLSDIPPTVLTRAKE